DRLGIRVGESLLVRLQSVTGQQNVGEFRVVAIIEDTGSFGLSSAYTSLAYLNSLIGLEPWEYQVFSIFLTDMREIEAVDGEIYQALVDLDESGPQSKIWLHELFADFDVGDRAFFRVGKQTVNWGVGYFFSPADIINIGRIDPEEPEAEREGPVAVRIHLLAGRVNYDVYTLVHGKPGDYRIALAPKAEFVYGGSEVGLGLYYRADRAPRAMATLSTSLLGRVAVFGEAVASFGSDKRFVKEAPGTLLGLSVYEDPDTVRFHFTAGARVNHSDPDGRFTVMAAGQYYYNGEGYDGEFLKENLGKMYGLVAMGQLASSDVLPLTVGRHYAALSVSGTSSSLRNVTPSVFWLGNLS